jgi:hypothetical protein
MQMDKEQYGKAKACLVSCMQEGHSWQVAKAQAGLQISQSNAYRRWRAFRLHSEAALSDGTHEDWLDENWQATPLPAPPMEPKLIPIVTTATEADAGELVQTYTRRWPAQENAIRDWLIPLGIDVNHGYAKTPVTNSEVTRKREVLQRRLENVKRWAKGARKRMHNASKLYNKRCKLTKERARELSHVLANHQITLEQQGMDDWLLRKKLKEEKATADAEIEEYEQRQWKAYHTSNKDFVLSLDCFQWSVYGVDSRCESVPISKREGVCLNRQMTPLVRTR